jgi:hypothetical protein
MTSWPLFPCFKPSGFESNESVAALFGPLHPCFKPLLGLSRTNRHPHFFPPPDQTLLGSSRTCEPVSGSGAGLFVSNPPGFDSNCQT